MRRPLLFLLLAAPSVALAVPSQLTTQGRVLDEDGDPVLGTLDVTFRVLDSETEGSTLWEETQAVALTNGFYSVVLGADESGNPLEDATLDQWPLWLEVQIDGEPAMAPRISIGSVPYARMAGMSEELQPGASLDVENLSVGGNEIIANDGSWTGTTPDVFWEDLLAVPADFADEDDADTLANLSCSDGQWAMFDAVMGSWVCDGFSDTTLSAAEITAAVNSAAVDLYVGSTLGGSPILTDSSSIDWSALTGVPSGLSDGDDDSLAALSCSHGQWAMFDVVTGSWGCNGFSDTTLSAADITAAVQAAAIDLYVGSTLDGSPILTDSSSIDWSALAGVPSGLGDGDDDSLASLSCGVGWIAVFDGSSWVCGEDATLSEADVEAFITDDAIDLPAGTTVDGNSLSTRYTRLLDADGYYWCALDDQVFIHCSQDFWGQAVLGQVLDATSAYNSTTDHVDVCALDTSGELSCYSVHGTSQPVTGTGYTALAGDEDVGCVLDSVGSTSCWGGASLSGSFTTIEGTSQVICGLSTTGALMCDYPGRSYNISEAGPWDWVDARKSTVCAGESTGSTYCWNNTSASVTRYSVAGSWDGFSGAFATWVYGCGVLSSGTLRCVAMDGSTVDHAGSWSDAIIVEYGWDSARPGVPTAITVDGVLFDPTRR